MNSLLFPDTRPARNEDGTLTAIVIQRRQASAGAVVLAAALPAGITRANNAGRYFLLRCGAQSDLERAENWSIYLRRPLFVADRPRAGQPAGDHDIWSLWFPPDDDPGYQWLAQLPQGRPLNLIGPLGNGFALADSTRRLLLVATAQRTPQLLALVDEILDRSGQVTLLVTDSNQMEDLRPQLPLSVELHCTQDPDERNALLTRSLRWADQVCAAIPADQWPALAELVTQVRMRLEPGYASVLVEADLACGVGACLACVVPLANSSYTRACLHGPVFDLLELVGRR